MEIGKQWKTIQGVLQESRSTLHCAMATVNENGMPHVTPIGSLFLRDNKTGFFFDQHTINTSRNLDHNPRVCVLAVNSNPSFWVKSLTEGKFGTPPAVRLMGYVGKRREATKEELEMWQNYVKYASETKGYDLIWKNMRMVRDIHFDSFEPVLTGEMTRGLWE